MNKKKKFICPVAHAGCLDNKIRRWLQNPQKILAPYIKKGMTVLDLGCGPGFFSIAMAKMVGESGRIIAADLQEGMLQKLRTKIRETEIEERIILHKCKEDGIGYLGQVDFVLAFYMVHEMSEPIMFFKEIKSILKSEGLLFIAEPKLFHVSKQAFKNTIDTAKAVGFELVEEPKLILSRAAILKKSDR